MRFHVTIPSTPCEEIWLDGEEAHHLLHVMRGKPGESVELFDGLGNVAQATVVVIERKRALLHLSTCVRVRPMPNPQITLLVALPKGDRQVWLIEKATELGVAALVPLITERGVAQPTDTALERLRRHSLQACKQSGRNYLLQITSPCAIGEIVVRHRFQRRYLADPGAKISLPMQCVELLQEPTPPESIGVAIGPEGGFTAQEINMLHLDWERVSLAQHILRIETAALAAATLLHAHFHSVSDH